MFSKDKKMTKEEKDKGAEASAPDKNNSTAQRKPVAILGIESSCDDTSAAVRPEQPL